VELKFDHSMTIAVDFNNACTTVQTVSSNNAEHLLQQNETREYLVTY